MPDNIIHPDYYDARKSQVEANDICQKQKETHVVAATPDNKLANNTDNNNI